MQPDVCASVPKPFIQVSSTALGRTNRTTVTSLAQFLLILYIGKQFIYISYFILCYSDEEPKDLKYYSLLIIMMF